MNRPAERALAELGAAGPLGAVCLLLANDHAFKRLYHNALTGKLSDVAICFFLPLLVSAALGLLTEWPGRRRLAIGAVVATLVFTMLELSDMAGALFVRAIGAAGLGSGALTRDPTDLLALVCVPLAVAYGRRRLAAAERGRNVWRSATGALVLATGSLALMATSTSVPPKVCDKPPAVMFQAAAGCGPGGPIVIQNSSQYPGFEISNAAAIGLLPQSAGACAWIDGRYLPRVNGDGGVCPTRWDDGTWELTSKDLVGGASDCGGGAIVTLETCSVVLAEGSGTVTCQPGDGGAPCTSRLTEAGDGGADGGLGGVDGSTNPSADGPSDVSP